MAENSTSSAKLSAKHKLFADEYLIDLNATAAYKRAGYGGKGKSAENAASRLLGNVGVSKYINDAMEKRSQDLGIDAKYVLTTIKATIERCQQAEPVMIRDGDHMVESGEYKFDASNVLKGAELLGKHLKMFTDKVDMNNSGSLTVEIRRFGDSSE